MNILSRAVSAPSAQMSLVVIASVGLGMFLNSTFSSSGSNQKIIPSPRDTLLPQLSVSEIRKLPYPPNALPGARDVQSPYGVFRVYEWGPEDGRKVLLIHGTSTPCIALGDLAHGLSSQGCRVILLDLWGKGYSDSPGDLQHDTRLYTTQLLLALATSPLSWTGTGSGRFSIIGYSLGGGIAASFTSHFPDLVRSLILLAPAGLIRPSRIGNGSRVLYSTGIFPENLLQWFVKRRLTNKPNIPPIKKGSSNPLAQELPSSEEDPTKAQSLPEPKLEVNTPATMEWQLSNHKGFINSFVSSIRYAPITGQHEEWQRIGHRLSAQNQRRDPLNRGAVNSGLDGGKVLLVLGEHDLVIVKNEAQEDMVHALGGEENVLVKIVDAGHELPLTQSNAIVGFVKELWSQ
ncbi:MAG: hypothetical protein M1837_000773 [Sclerophora amabilis]|nr:MAG: hypothetical protein M1837_000773 [Sclerophora amabilis]